MRFAVTLCLLSAICGIVLGASSSVHGAAPELPFSNSTVVNFKRFFFANIDYENVGAIMASPSKSYPNYFYDWVRDSGITMSIAPKLLNESARTTLYEHYQHWTRICHLQPQVNGYDIRGEPKYYMNGNVFDGPWGRPQTDGPALRALALIDYAHYLLSKDKRDIVLDQLWRHEPNECCGIKYDVEFISKEWRNPTFDVWEEVMGNHFFTLIIQRKALVKASDLAIILNDEHAANYYMQQAAEISNTLEKFWNPSTNIIEVTRNAQGGADKYNGLDTAVLLGVLYGGMEGYSFNLNDERVLSTANNLVNFFNTSSMSGFTINDEDYRDLRVPESTLLGRYPSDTYNGVTTDGLGNPWFLTTSATAEVYFRTAAHLGSLAKSNRPYTISRISSGFFASLISAIKPDNHSEESFKNELFKFSQEQPRSKVIRSNVANNVVRLAFQGFNVGSKLIEITDKSLIQFLAKATIKAADGFFLRIIRHLHNDHMAEQINRVSGYQEGARDLTWSYGTTLSAITAREEAVGLVYGN